jgi:hypothetical protein
MCRSTEFRRDQIGVFYPLSEHVALHRARHVSHGQHHRPFDDVPGSRADASGQLRHDTASHSASNG